MPKMKTKRLARKKFKVTSSGKVKFSRAGMRHNTGKKSARKGIVLGPKKIASKANRRALRLFLPYESIA